MGILLEPALWLLDAHILHDLDGAVIGFLLRHPGFGLGLLLLQIVQHFLRQGAIILFAWFGQLLPVTVQQVSQGFADVPPCQLQVNEVGWHHLASALFRAAPAGFRFPRDAPFLSGIVFHAPEIPVQMYADGGAEGAGAAVFPKRQGINGGLHQGGQAACRVPRGLFLQGLRLKHRQRLLQGFHHLLLGLAALRVGALQRHFHIVGLKPGVRASRFLHAGSQRLFQRLQLGLRIFPAGFVVQQGGLRHLLAHLHDRVKGGQGILEHHGQVVAANLVELILRIFEQILALVDDFSALHDGVGGVDADDGLGRDGLAGAGFPHDGKGFALVQVEADAANRLDIAACCMKGQAEIFHF